MVFVCLTFPAHPIAWNLFWHKNSRKMIKKRSNSVSPYARAPAHFQRISRLFALWKPSCGKKKKQKNKYTQSPNGTSVYNFMKICIRLALLMNLAIVGSDHDHATTSTLILPFLCILQLFHNDLRWLEFIILKIVRTFEKKRKIESAL